MSNPTQTVMGAAEAAARLEISRSHLQRLVSSGRLTANKLPGRRGAYLFDPADVAAFAAKRVSA